MSAVIVESSEIGENWVRNFRSRSTSLSSKEPGGGLKVKLLHTCLLQWIMIWAMLPVTSKTDFSDLSVYEMSQLSLSIRMPYKRMLHASDILVFQFMGLSISLGVDIFKGFS